MADTADLVVLGAYIGTGNKGKHLFTLHQIFVPNNYFDYYTIMMKYLLCLFKLVLYIVRGGSGRIAKSLHLIAF